MRVDSISALRALTPTTGDLAELTGYYLPGDGGGGNFYWDGASTAPDNNGTVIQPDSHPTSGRWKRVITAPIDVSWFGAKGDGLTDDTAAITSAVTVATTGSVIFASRGIYVISTGLNLTYPVTIDLNGATIQFPAAVATTSISAFAVNSDNVTIKNGKILGTFNPATDTPAPGAGPIGINNNSSHANLTVDHITIEKVQSYGIVAFNGANPTFTNNTFLNTGYISLFCISSVSAINGGLVDGNIFDRSGIPATNVTQDCVAIRGNSSTALTSNWIFTNNKIIMPISPADPAAECIEVRYMINSTINNNVFITGSIGLSIVGCYNVTSSGNTCFGSAIGMEIAGGSYNVLDSNVIDGNNIPGSMGILLDGADGAAAMYNTLSSNNVSKVKTSCIQIYHTANYNSIMGGILTQTTPGQACINIIGAQGTLTTGVRMNGASTGGRGVMMDNSGYGGNNNYITSGTVINGCIFADFTSAAMTVYASTGGTITGLRITNNTLKMERCYLLR